MWLFAHGIPLGRIIPWSGNGGEAVPRLGFLAAGCLWAHQRIGWCGLAPPFYHCLAAFGPYIWYSFDHPPRLLLDSSWVYEQTVLGPVASCYLSTYSAGGSKSLRIIAALVVCVPELGLCYAILWRALRSPLWQHWKKPVKGWRCTIRAACYRDAREPFSWNGAPTCRPRGRLSLGIAVHATDKTRAVRTTAVDVVPTGRSSLTGRHLPARRCPGVHSKVHGQHRRHHGGRDRHGNAGAKDSKDQRHLRPRARPHLYNLQRQACRVCLRHPLCQLPRQGSKQLFQPPK